MALSFIPVSERIASVRSRILFGCESLRRSHLQHDFWCVRYAAVACKRVAQQIAQAAYARSI